jgi:hypothetical protein
LAQRQTEDISFTQQNLLRWLINVREVVAWCCVRTSRAQGQKTL